MQLFNQQASKDLEHLDDRSRLQQLEECIHAVSHKNYRTRHATNLPHISKLRYLQIYLEEEAYKTLESSGESVAALKI